MLDQSDLQAMRQMVQEMIDASEERTLKRTAEMIDASEERTFKRMAEAITASEERTAQKTIALMDLEFTSKFNLLAENQQILLDRMVPTSRVDELEEEVKLLKMLYRKVQEEVNELKGA